LDVSLAGHHEFLVTEEWAVFCSGSEQRNQEAQQHLRLDWDEGVEDAWRWHDGWCNVACEAVVQAWDE
jgi:hypothetical protein